MYPNTIKLKALLFAAIAIGILSITSCKKEEIAPIEEIASDKLSSDTTNVSEELIGTWEAYEVYYHNSNNGYDSLISPFTMPSKISIDLSGNLKLGTDTFECKYVLSTKEIIVNYNQSSNKFYFNNSVNPFNAITPKKSSLSHSNTLYWNEYSNGQYTQYKFKKQ